MLQFRFIFLGILIMNIEQLQIALFNLYDIKNVLSNKIKNQLSNEDTEETIGDALENSIEILEQLEYDLTK